jgi:hypothetical protein
MHCDVYKVFVCVELHQGSKPIEGVWSDAHCRLDCDLQLIVVGVEDGIGFPLLVHITRVPQGTELRSQRFKWIDVWEGRTFWHLPCNESYQYEKPAEVEIMSLVLHSSTIKI